MGRRSHQKAARSASRSPIGTESSRPGPPPSTDGHFSLDGGFAPALETAGRGRKRGMPERRIVFVDAARGLAVALALYIHSLATFGSWYRLPLLGQGLVRLITCAATPTVVGLVPRPAVFCLDRVAWPPPSSHLSYLTAMLVGRPVGRAWISLLHSQALIVVGMTIGWSLSAGSETRRWTVFYRTATIVFLAALAVACAVMVGLGPRQA